MTTLNQNNVQLMKEPSESAMNLPEGWAECQLSDVIYVQNGYAFPSEDYRDTGVPLIRQTNLAGDKLLLDKCVFLDPSYLQSKKDFVLRKGDILVGMSGSLGKICIYDLDYPALQNQRTGRIVPYSENALIRKYFYYFLQTVENDLQAKGKGLGVSNISASDIESLSFRLAPIAEQQRIVAKVEELLQRVNVTKNRQAKVTLILKRFRQAVLAAACSGRLTADWREEKTLKSERWTEAVLKDVAQLRLGKMLDKAKNIGKPVLYLRNLNVRWFSFDLSSLAKMRVTPREQRELEIRDGDLLVCEGGEPGRCAVWDLGPSDLIFQKAVHRIRVKGNVAPHWVALNIRNDANSGRLEDYFTGTTIKHLTGKALATYRFPLPPLPEQSEIVRRVDSMFKLADAAEKRVAAATLRAEKLTQAILAKAFRGELVATEAELARREGRSYETALELLARIKSEHDAKRVSERVRRSQRQQKSVDSGPGPKISPR